MGAGILVLICTRLREKEGNEPGIDVLLLNMFAISGTVMILSPNYYYYFLIVKDYQGFFFFNTTSEYYTVCYLSIPHNPCPLQKELHAIHCIARNKFNFKTCSSVDTSLVSSLLIPMHSYS